MALLTDQETFPTAAKTFVRVHPSRKLYSLSVGAHGRHLTAKYFDRRLEEAVVFLQSPGDRMLEWCELVGLPAAEPFEISAEQTLSIGEELDDSAATTKRVTQLERENAELRIYAERFLPHKRFFRVAMAFQAFFGGSLLLQVLAGGRLLSPVLGWTGFGASTAVVLLSYLRSIERD